MKIPANLESDFALCRRITSSHDENFSVVSRFVPRHIRPHFCSIYAFCRTVDDIGDELDGDRLSALQAFEAELERCYGGQPKTPMFRALMYTIETFGIDQEPFHRLIEANRRDQVVKAYATWAELEDYCRYSADPVGRLVLALFGYQDDRRRELSDDTCTALQVANHLQDMHRDMLNGRIYLPEEDMKRFGTSSYDVTMACITEPLRACIRYEVDRTDALFRQGAELERMVPRRLAMQLRLYRLGGQAVLDALRRQNYDPFISRPIVRSRTKLWIACQTLMLGSQSRR